MNDDTCKKIINDNHWQSFINDLFVGKQGETTAEKTNKKKLFFMYMCVYILIIKQGRN